MDKYKIKGLSMVIQNKPITAANVSLFLIGLMVYLPFIMAYHRLPIPSFHGEWLAMLLGMAALFPLFKHDSWQPLEIPHIAFVFVGFIAIVCIQMLLGLVQSTKYASLVISYLAWALLLVLLGSHLRRQLGWEQVAMMISWGIFAGGCTNIIFILLQYSGQFFSFIPVRPNVGVGAIGQLNHFGNYIALAMASVIYLVLKKRLTVATGTVISLLFLVLLALTGSRSTWLYLIAFVMGAFLFNRTSVLKISTTSALQVRQSKHVLYASLALLPLYLVIQLLVSFLGTDIALPNDRLLDEFGGRVAVGGIGVRLHVWFESLQLFLQSPWFGIGVGQTRWMSFLMLDTQWSVDLPGSYEHAHNLVLQLMAEMGIGAALLLVFGIVAWLRGIQWKHINLESWWLFAILSVIGIHSMLEYPLWYAYFLGITAFLLGAGDEKCRQIHFGMVTQAIGRAASTLIMLIGLVLLTNTFIANSKLEAWVSHGIYGQITTENQPDFYRALSWVSEHSLLSSYVNVVYAIALNPEKKNLEDKIWLSESALRFIPTKTTAYRHALLLELNGQHKEAVQYLQRAVQAYPKDFKAELQKMPMQYWELYLRLFSEAIAKPATQSTKN